MAKSLNDILQRYSDVISGKLPASKIEPLTTGENPGVDYADKMKDGRDFLAMHSVEKHPDRNGNGDDVFKGSTTKAKMERHGHEPKPKDIQVYNKTQQQNEEYELDETSGAKAERYKKAARSGLLNLAVHTKDGPDKKRKIVNRAAGLERADRAIDKDIAKRSAAQKKRLGEAKDDREYGYEGEMAMSQIKSIMNHSQQLMKMLKPDTDMPEWVQSKITLACDYMQTAADYFATEMNEEVEEIDEGGSQYRSAAGSGKNTNPNLSRLARKLAFEKPKSFRPPGEKSKAENRDILNAEVAKFMKKGGKIRKEEVEELDEAKCNMTEAGKMCEVHGMKACSKEGTDSASDKEPRYNGKKKEGRQLITDKKLQEMATSQAQQKLMAMAYRYKQDPNSMPDASEQVKKLASTMTKNQLHDFAATKRKGLPDKVEESLADQRSSRSTASEKAREKITAALEKRKLAKEQSAPAETIIKMPSGEVGDTGRV